MNKKLIVGGIAILSMTAIITQQANASSSRLENESENETKIEHMNKGLRMGSGSHTGLHIGSGSHTGLHLGSGMKMRSGEKMGSGKKEHMGTGKKEYMGSGSNIGTGMNKKIEKLGSVFKKMSDDKLTLLLAQINTLTTTVTDPTLLSIINSIKTMIQNNIGN